MTITRGQVAGLNYGDIITLTGHDEPGVITTGPVSEGAGGAYWLGARIHLGDFGGVNLPGWVRRGEATLTVVSRAPRPLYVNHDRKRPSIGDVVREEPDEAGRRVWLFDGNDWWFGDGVTVQMVEHDKMPTRLRLLVDGVTGQVVPS